MKIIVGLLVATMLGSTGAFAQDPVKLSPKMYTILLENDQVRVLEFRCKPGEKEPMHSHPALVGYALTLSKFRSTTSDGKTTEGQSKPGTTSWGDPVTHAWECLGPGEQRTVLIELKGRAKP